MTQAAEDKRVSRAFEWVSGVLASILVVLLVWVGSTLMAVQQDVAVVKVQIAPTANRMDRIEAKGQCGEGTFHTSGRRC